jgi:hypothetical protein
MATRSERRAKRVQERKERKKYRGGVQSGICPTGPGYTKTVQMMDLALRKWLQLGASPPRYAFPPEGIGLVADLRAVEDVIARNDEAHRFAQVCYAIGRKNEEDLGLPSMPSAIMLQAVLLNSNVEVESISLTEFGVEGVGLA